MQSKPKILFQNRRRSLWQGGDYIQLDYTVEALRKLGYEIDISDEYVVSVDTIKQYDIVHLWNFSMEWTKFQLWVARKHKIPVICSMIYHETDTLIPYNLQQIMIDELSYAIFQTKGESERAKRHLTIKEEKIVIIQNGIDPYWLEQSQSKIPIERFILTVGRIESSKGQLEAAIACKQLGIQYICIGEVMDEEYGKKLKKLDVEIMPFMNKEHLKPWYYSASVYIQPSEAETWSLCVDEAGSQGTPIILTEMCERDEYPFIRCKPHDVESIKNAIKGSLEIYRDFEFKKTLKTWDSIALDIAKLYEKILNTDANKK
jgi:glycosyltransferase involved in cell wall biosynthesis